MAPRAARSGTGLRSLLLLPPRHPRPEDCEDSWRGSARKTSGSLGSLLGEFLPRRFRQFLSQLGAEWVEQPQTRTSSELPYQRGVSKCWQGHSPPSPDCSFLPDLRSRSLNFQNSLKKSSLDQIPTLGPLRRDQEQFTKVKKANRPHSLRVPKLKAELTHSSEEEGSGHHRRCSPFRVRFADETVWDTAFRYWERNRARKQLGWGAPNSRKFQPAPGRADPVALGAGRKAPARKGQKPAESAEEAPELAPPGDVRVTFKDKVEGPRSGRSVPKQAAPGSSHSTGPGNHGCPDLATMEGLLASRVLTGCIRPPPNRCPQPSTPVSGSPYGLQGLVLVGGRQKHLLPVFGKAELDEGVSRKFQKIREDQHHWIWQRSWEPADTCFPLSHGEWGSLSAGAWFPGEVTKAPFLRLPGFFSPQGPAATLGAVTSKGQQSAYIFFEHLLAAVSGNSCPEPSCRESPKNQDYHQLRGIPEGPRKLQREAVMLPNFQLFDEDTKGLSRWHSHQEETAEGPRPLLASRGRRRPEKQFCVNGGCQAQESFLASHRPGELRLHPWAPDWGSAGVSQPLPSSGSLTVQQDVTKNSPATQSEAALEHAFESVGRWGESLPKALDSQAKEEAVASSLFSWDSPSLPIPELEDYLFEDSSANSSLPCIPRATTQRQQRDRKTFLGAHSILDQVGKSPCSWSQKLESFLPPRLELHKILNRDHPKGYQLLLPSAASSAMKDFRS